MVDFERRRAAIGQVQADQIDKDDRELLKYTTLSRSIKDQGSMTGRFHIFDQEFRRFLKRA